MASRLKGLFLGLTWADFPVEDKPDPGEHARVHIAQTSAHAFPSGLATEFVKGSKPDAYRMADTFLVEVKFIAKESWVAKFFIDSADDDLKQRMLKHEQGHYDLVALLARDFFIAVMQLKAQTFASSGEVASAVTALQTDILGKAEAIDKRYEDDTKNGTVVAMQSRWNAFFETSFTKEREPRQEAPDGKAYKIPLLQVLSDANITF